MSDVCYLLYKKNWVSEILMSLDLHYMLNMNMYFFLLSNCVFYSFHVDMNKGDVFDVPEMSQYDCYWCSKRE